MKTVSSLLKYLFFDEIAWCNKGATVYYLRNRGCCSLFCKKIMYTTGSNITRATQFQFVPHSLCKLQKKFQFFVGFFACTSGMRVCSAVYLDLKSALFSKIHVQSNCPSSIWLRITHDKEKKLHLRRGSDQVENTTAWSFLLHNIQPCIYRCKY